MKGGMNSHDEKRPKNCVPSLLRVCPLLRAPLQHITMHRAMPIGHAMSAEFFISGQSLNFCSNRYKNLNSGLD